MTTIDQLSSALVKADAAGDVDGARVLAAEIRKMQSATPESPKPDYRAQAIQMAKPELLQPLKNIAGGAIRGAGSIGATAMRILPNMLGGDTAEENAQRRSDMDAGLQNLIGADPESFGYQAGKLGGEIAGTAGVPVGLAALGARAGMSANALSMLASGGFRGGNMLQKAAAGATVGGISAGMVNPNDAATGAAIGGVLPGAVKLAGAIGSKIGNEAALSASEKMAKFDRSAPLRDTVKSSVEAGYVVPPNMVSPSAKNAMIESFSGKQATSQLASVRNQDVTEKLTRQALGIPADAPLKKATLEGLRKTAGKTYEEVASLSPQAKTDLEMLKQVRNDAQGWFNAYNRSASPADLARAKEFRGAAEALEAQLESHAVQAGKAELIPALREARKQIAKTYTVERALNDATGTVNAKVFGRLFDKSKPLSDGLDTVGKFASAFPSVNQASQQMGSPAAHNLRAFGSMLLGGGGLAALGPSGIVAAALPYAASSGARALMFSKSAQEALANQAAPSANMLYRLTQNKLQQDAMNQALRSAPVIAAD